MKFIKLLLCLFAVCCIVSLAACNASSEEQSSTKDEKPPHVCSYTTLTETVAATCDSAGYTVYSCECGLTETTTTPALGCSYGQWEITKNPTIGGFGSIAKTCANNSEHKESAFLPELTSSSYTVEITQAATLTEPGVASYKYSYNGESFTLSGPVLYEAYSMTYGNASLNLKANLICDEDKSAHFTVPETYAGLPVTQVSFYQCDFVETISLTDKVTSVDFRKSPSLKSITVPPSVRSLELSECANLESVVISDGVEKISKNAFYKCPKLKSVTIPDSVTEIGERAFMGCAALTEIALPAELTEISVGLFEDCALLGSIVIPDKVTSIGYYAFANCTALASVTFGRAVEKIGGAFGSCSGLSKVYYNGDVADWCAIEFVDFGANPLSVGTAEMYVAYNGDYVSVFDSCSYLSSAGANPTFMSFDFLVIPDSVTRIGQYQFTGLNNAEGFTLVIEGAVTEIGESAFAFCTINDVILPATVNTVVWGAFNSSLQSDSEIYFGGDKAALDSLIASTEEENIASATVNYYAADENALTGVGYTNWCYGDDGHVYEWVYNTANGQWEKEIQKHLSHDFFESLD